MGGHARHLPVRRGHAVLLIGRASTVFEDWLNQAGLTPKLLHSNASAPSRSSLRPRARGLRCDELRHWHGAIEEVHKWVVMLAIFLFVLAMLFS